MVKQAKRSIWMLLLLLLGMQIVFASEQVLDIILSENYYQETTYSPNVGLTSGPWADTYEVVNARNGTGTITVINNHSSEAVENIVLNFTTAQNIYNITHLSGTLANITDYSDGQSYATIAIPDLGPGDQSVLLYYINATMIQPALNLTPEYNDVKALAGTKLTVTDHISNTLNSSHDDTCIYNINITQTALTIDDQDAGVLQFTFNITDGLSGNDAVNASIGLTQIQWDAYGRDCFSPGDAANISYNVDTPYNVSAAADYPFSNSTVSWRVNATVSLLHLTTLTADADLYIDFEKQLDQVQDGDNATWQITGNITSDINLTVNVTTVSFWVSHRNAGGGGFTSPGNITNDTISGASLNRTYFADTLINNSLSGWNNVGSEWRFNYTSSISPIVWMDFESHLLDDGVQITNRSVSFGNNEIYTKEIYLVTGYWIEISRNITRLADNNFSVFIEVVNRGTSPTPTDQVVVVYNFLDNNFNLTSVFDFSDSPWYNTTETNTSLNDPPYVGVMYQYALIADSVTNPYNSSFAAYNGAKNINNTWNVTYNITGSGAFAFDDLFLTGVDPLHVSEYGATQALTVENVFKVLSGSGEYVLVGVAGLVAVLLVLF